MYLDTHCSGDEVAEVWVVSCNKASVVSSETIEVVIDQATWITMHSILCVWALLGAHSNLHVQ